MSVNNMTDVDSDDGCCSCCFNNKKQCCYYKENNKQRCCCSSCYSKRGFFCRGCWLWCCDGNSHECCPGYFNGENECCCCCFQDKKCCWPTRRFCKCKESGFCCLRERWSSSDWWGPANAFAVVLLYIALCYIVVHVCAIRYGKGVWKGSGLEVITSDTWADHSFGYIGIFGPKKNITIPEKAVCLKKEYNLTEIKAKVLPISSSIYSTDRESSHFLNVVTHRQNAQVYFESSKFIIIAAITMMALSAVGLLIMAVIIFGRFFCIEEESEYCSNGMIYLRFFLAECVLYIGATLFGTALDIFNIGVYDVFDEVLLYASWHKCPLFNITFFISVLAGYIPLNKRRFLDLQKRMREKHIEIRDYIKAFDGQSADAVTWISEVESTIMQQLIPKVDACIFLSSCLQGAAQNFFQSLPDHRKNNIEQIRSALLKEYAKQDPRAIAYIDLMKRKFQTDEELDCYQNDIERLANQAEIGDKILIQAFIRGLPSDVSEKIKMPDKRTAMTLDQLKKKAQNLINMKTRPECEAADGTQADQAVDSPSTSQATSCQGQSDTPLKKQTSNIQSYHSTSDSQRQDTQGSGTAGHPPQASTCTDYEQGAENLIDGAPEDGTSKTKKCACIVHSLTGIFIILLFFLYIEIMRVGFRQYIVKGTWFGCEHPDRFGEDIPYMATTEPSQKSNTLSPTPVPMLASNKVKYANEKWVINMNWLNDCHVVFTTLANESETCRVHREIMKEQGVYDRLVSSRNSACVLFGISFASIVLFLIMTLCECNSGCSSGCKNGCKYGRKSKWKTLCKRCACGGLYICYFIAGFIGTIFFYHFELAAQDVFDKVASKRMEILMWLSYACILLIKIGIPLESLMQSEAKEKEMLYSHAIPQKRGQYSKHRQAEAIERDMDSHAEWVSIGDPPGDDSESIALVPNEEVNVMTTPGPAQSQNNTVI